MQRRIQSRSALIALLMTIWAGCDAEQSSDSDTQASFDESDVTDALTMFEQEGFVRMSKAPSSSQHALADAVVIWVHEDSATTYRGIDPDDPNATATFDEGTIIVKQNIAANGEPDGSGTVMAKFPRGFNPEAGDWWWGRFDEKRKLVEDGVVQYCIDCHVGNDLARTDYVKGVPSTNQR
jgi:hypothetical protein